MLLDRIGFYSAVARAAAQAPCNDTDALMRVTEVSRATCKVHDGSAVYDARPLPALERQPPTVVGDWMIVTRDPHGAHWLAARVPPYTELTRIAPSGARQALVANVDFALLVMGLDELAERMPGDLERYAVNATDATSLACLAHHFGPGNTGVLLGSSGAGKSTLTNTFLGQSTQQTGAVRESDSRGRHTTTIRQLHLLPGGACLIDTPGLRGLRLDMDEDSLDEAFAEIGALAAHCRFRDCRHEHEPGCAVRVAVPPDRLANYQKLRREIARETATPTERERARGRAKSQERALRAVLNRKRNPRD
jgi:ribosome biogenesis GTPase